MSALKISVLPFTSLVSQFGLGKFVRILKKPSYPVGEEFLRTASDVRLMDWTESVMAAQRTSDPAIKR